MIRAFLFIANFDFNLTYLVLRSLFLEKLKTLVINCYIRSSNKIF